MWGGGPLPVLDQPVTPAFNHFLQPQKPFQTFLEHPISRLTFVTSGQYNNPQYNYYLKLEIQKKNQHQNAITQSCLAKQTVYLAPPNDLKGVRWFITSSSWEPSNGHRAFAARSRHKTITNNQLMKEEKNKQTKKKGFVT